MKTIKHLFTLLLLLCATEATAHGFEVDGVYYNILSGEDKTVEVTYRGTSYGQYANEYYDNVVIPESVVYNGTTYGVTSIGDYAFYGCPDLTSIEIPSCVTSIGNSAFYNCSGLTSIEIPNSVTCIGNSAFYNCSGLASVEMPDSITKVGENAFTGTAWYNNQPNGVVYIGKVLYKYKGTMPANTSIVVKDGTLSIGEKAFYNCSGLTSVKIPNSITSVGNKSFYACKGLANIVIPDGVTSIGDEAFCGCTNLANVEIPNSITSVGAEAFAGSAWYNNLPDGVVYVGKVLYKYKGKMPANTEIIVNDSTLSITDGAFNGCARLKSIKFPNSITSIGSSVFYGCYELTVIVIPNSVTSIGGNAFKGCSELKTVINFSNLTFSKGSSDYGYIADYADKVINAPNGYIDGDYVWYEKDNENILAGYIGSATELTLPTDYKGKKYAIGTYAFRDCTSLTSIIIPNSVTSIGASAFNGCTSLTSIIIPNSVTSIGTYAFYGCSGLADVLIGNSVTSIGEAAFSGCTGLTSVINLSSLTFSKGSIAYGSVAYDADIVINAPNGYVDGGYVWFENEDGMTLASCLGAVAELTLPAEYKGKSVTFIGDYAFYGCTALESIVIPNSVTGIGNYAFNGCTSLKDLCIEAGKDSLSLGYKNYAHSSGKGLFCDCPLESLYLGRDLSYNTSSSYGYSPFYNKSTLASVTISDSVTNIGEYAFCGCKGLTNLVIPNSVTSIGTYAFYGCSGLTSIEIPNSVTSIGSSAFQNCAGIASVIIGNGVTDIKFRTFFGCSGLTSVVFGNSVVDINGAAFEYCRIRTIINLSSLTFRKGSIAYGYVAYDADIVINAPNGYIVGDYVWSEVDGENILAGYVGDAADLTLPANCNGENYAVGESVFYANTTITNIVMPDNVTRIGDSAFYGCTNLASIEISNSVTSIGEFAFRGCTSLTNIVLPNSVTNVGMYAFYECSGLTNVVISDSVTRIEEGLFRGCSALTSIEIPNSVTGIRFYAFQYCTGLTSVVIGNGVTDIEFNAFSGCSNLANVIIGDNVKYIGSKAFEGCTALNGIVFPDNLVDINEQAFYKCSGLTNIVIGNGVRYIDSSAFFGCSSLKTVINCSKLTFSKGATDYGYVAYYADKVINAPNGYVDGDYVWAVVNEENTLCGYIGNEKELVLPSSCNGEDYAIGNSAFYNCTGLTSIEIPSVITDIKDDAFYGCTGLKEVHISDLAAWCDIYFASAEANPLYYAKNLYLNGDLVTDVVVPDVLPEIHKYAFINCSGLTNVVVSDGIDVIGESAFSGCSNVETVYISNSIYKINDNAFAGCNKIYDIKVGAKKPIGGNVNIFANAVYDNATLYIPNGTKSLYEKREPWNRFFYIKEMDFTGIEEVFDDVETEIGNRKGVCYDLNGRVVENPASGIYIIDGKKVLVK